MKEQDLKNYIKTAVKTPSAEFTDKLMVEISALPNKAPTQNKRMFKILIFASCFILILSLNILLISNGKDNRFRGPNTLF